MRYGLPFHFMVRISSYGNTRVNCASCRGDPGASASRPEPVAVVIGPLPPVERHILEGLDQRRPDRRRRSARPRSPRPAKGCAPRARTRTCRASTEQTALCAPGWAHSASKVEYPSIASSWSEWFAKARLGHRERVIDDLDHLAVPLLGVQPLVLVVVALIARHVPGREQMPQDLDRVEPSSAVPAADAGRGHARCPSRSTQGSTPSAAAPRSRQSPCVVRSPSRSIRW